jgi:RNA polymerase sigma factor (sigma-70 family)
MLYRKSLGAFLSPYFILYKQAKKMKLSESINTAYKNWLTSEDKDTRDASFEDLVFKLKEVTRTIIYDECNNLLNETDDIFAEMILKVYYAKENDKINTTDFFISWYRKALKNHLLNEIKYRNRKKREFIEYESDLPFDLAVAEVKFCLDIYNKQEIQVSLHDIFEQIFNSEKDRELFCERHLDNISEVELADRNNTTVDGIKSRLKRAKQRMKIMFNNLINQ